MSRNARCVARLLLGLLCSEGTTSLAAFAQTTRSITGIVSDSSGIPIRYARVEAGKTGALASDSGRFVLTLESTRPLVLEIRRIGFRPVSLKIPAGGDTTVAVTMVAVVQQLSAVRVLAEQVHKLEVIGFYERMANRKKWGGSAQFLTPEDIEQRHPNRATQLFEGLNGVSPRRAGSCQILVRCWVAVGYGNCLMTVYLDGHRLEPEVVGSMPRRLSPVFVDELAHVAEISAIEVYSRPTQAPPQYQADVGKCGVILIWTK